MALDLDWQIRLAAFERIEQLRGIDRLVSASGLDEGFVFEGTRIALWSSRRGIWRPEQLARASGAALTIVTAPPVPGKAPPYDDQVASDSPTFVYRYRGNDPSAWDNVAVRRAMELQRPLIYLYGIDKGSYEPIYPCYVVGDDPSQLAFYLTGDLASAMPPVAAPPTPTDEIRRGYATRAVKVRLHQERFRKLVVDAYRKRCAVCNLRHPELLDAAHILADRDERGKPEIPNGLSLCKIHHGAYDANILGISPDYRVEIRLDILEERDGPMLRYGLQAMHEQKLLIPSNEQLRPRRDYLEERYTVFKQTAA
jgi:putative restriction endonuclease